MVVSDVRKSVFQLSKGVKFIEDNEQLFCQVKRGDCLTRFRINQAIKQYLLRFESPRRVSDVIEEKLMSKPNEYNECQLIKFTQSLLQTPLLTDCSIDHQFPDRILQSLFPGMSHKMLKQRKLDGVFKLEDQATGQYKIGELGWRQGDKPLKSQIVRKLTNEHSILHQITSLDITPKAGELQIFSDFVMFTMEYIDGKPLTAIDIASLSMKNRLRLAAQVVSHFSTIHNAEFLHGDIHTSNVLCCDDSRIKIIDFDCSHLKQVLPQGRIGGAPNFFPPERVCDDWHNGQQAPSTEVGEVYQVAVIVYQLLVGNLPFRGKTYQELMQAIKKGYDSHHALQISTANLPQQLSGWLEQCLVTNPKYRVQRLEDMITIWNSYV